MTSSIPRTSWINGDHLQSTAQSSWASGKAERRAGTTGRVCTKSPRELRRTARSRFEWEVDTLVPFQLVVTNCGKPRSKSLFRSEEHTSELQSLTNLVCRLLLEKKK